MMSKSNTAIKVLRQNFIKKHQVHPDYFIHGERPIDEETFCDREMFYPKEFLRKNNHQGQGKLFSVRKKEEQSNNIHTIKLQLNHPNQKSLKIVPKSITPCLTTSDEGGHFVSRYSSIPLQPSFIKTQKLRRKVVSARESKRPLPRFSVYIMKPCSVAPAKMEQRPQSALTRKKSQQLNKYMGFGLKRQQQSQQLKRPEQYFMPWQTEYEQL